MNSPQNFLPKTRYFAFCPGQVRQAVAVMPLAAKVL
ncbi:single-stranded DNA-binding protein, partial [Escherichia coli]